MINASAALGLVALMAGAPAPAQTHPAGSSARTEGTAWRGGFRDLSQATAAEIKAAGALDGLRLWDSALRPAIINYGLDAVEGIIEGDAESYNLNEAQVSTYRQAAHDKILCLENDYWQAQAYPW